MNLYQFLSALRARFGLFAFLLLTTVAVATVVSFVLPKTYTATVSLLVDAKEEQSLGNAARPMILQQEKASYMQTQLDIITSEKVARKVAQDLKLAQNPMAAKAVEETARAGGAAEDKLIEGLQDQLKVDTSQSSVMRLSFTARDPRFAADAANAFAQAYIDTMLELRVEPTQKAAAWFDEQLKTLRANLESAQAKLTDYHQKRGIVSADERGDVENTRLAVLSEQVGRAQEQTFEWKSRDEQARNFAARGESPDRMTEVRDNPFIQKLKEDLSHGEAKLQELSANYGPNYPQYQRQAAEVESLKGRLDAEMKKVVVGIENSARQSRQREFESRKAMDAQRTRVLGLKEDRNELTVLRRNVESAERAYDTAMQRSVVSQVDSRANQTNVMILNPAPVPRKHSHPKIFLNIALSVVVGTILGIVMVMLLELLDRRVRSRNDLELDVPLLAVLNERVPASRRLLGWSGGAHRPGLPNHRPSLPNPG
jgi:succinoglycan biosynthesis transport protein ExoP